MTEQHPNGVQPTAAMSQWQPIETAPKDASRILIHLPADPRTGREAKTCEAWWALEYEDGPGHWQTPHGPGGRGYTILPEAATHWMPLPAPPTAGVECLHVKRLRQKGPWSRRRDLFHRHRLLDLPCDVLLHRIRARARPGHGGTTLPCLRQQPGDGPCTHVVRRVHGEARWLTGRSSSRHRWCVQSKRVKSRRPDMTPWLSPAEVDDLCAPLVQPAAKCRFLRELGLAVKEKPNGQPLVLRSNVETVLGGLPAPGKKNKGRRGCAAHAGAAQRRGPAACLSRGSLRCRPSWVAAGRIRTPDWNPVSTRSTGRSTTSTATAVGSTWAPTRKPRTARHASTTTPTACTARSSTGWTAS
jgi:hypothetical protein